jgi:hypothetical protein
VVEEEKGGGGDGCQEEGSPEQEQERTAAKPSPPHEAGCDASVDLGDQGSVRAAPKWTAAPSRP